MIFAIVVEIINNNVTVIYEASHMPKCITWKPLIFQWVIFQMCIDAVSIILRLTNDKLWEGA